MNMSNTSTSYPSRKAPRYVSTAAPERARFAPVILTLSLSCLMIVALVIVYPAHSLQDRLESSVKVDAVSMAYLGAWLHAMPDDYSLRMVLARHELRAGDLEQAQSSLGPVISAAHVPGPEHLAAELLLLDILERRLWSADASSPLYPMLHTSCLRQLRLVAALPSEQTRLPEFAKTALALGDFGLGRELYARMIHAQPGSHPELIQELARINLMTGDYANAADAYFDALPFTSDIDQRRQFFLAGLRILQSGNLLTRAVTASQTYVGPLTDDRQTLTYLVGLALADHRADVAAHFAARLLKQRVNFRASA
jgi:thioredoxin-like negative regulator of GroEL